MRVLSRVLFRDEFVGVDVTLGMYLHGLVTRTRIATFGFSDL